MFNPENFRSAFPVPPEGVRILRQSFLYDTTDTLADVYADDYFADAADKLHNGDFVTVTSTNPTDGCANVAHWVSRTDIGAVFIQLPMQPRRAP